MNRNCPGTVIVEERVLEGSPPLSSVASRGGVELLRGFSRDMLPGEELRMIMAGEIGGTGCGSSLFLSTETAVTAVMNKGETVDRLVESLSHRVQVERLQGMAILCAVGARMAVEDRIRKEVLESLCSFTPEIVLGGPGGNSITAVLSEETVGEAVRKLHGRFFRRGQN
jgi:aspartokinase